jgi:hypothetical protein
VPAGGGRPLWSASGPTIISFGFKKRVNVERSTIARLWFMRLQGFAWGRPWHTGADVLRGR